METATLKNTYLEQVCSQGRQLEDDLRPRRACSPKAMLSNPACADAPVPAGEAGRDVSLAEPRERAAGSGLLTGGRAVDYRITGFWSWKNVIVPPNAYVVHTRRGRPEPLHLGLGVSFRFNPLTDSFLVVPSAMQTIILNANCICRERQGILVQGYVQWIIDDFGTAYRKLDFSDTFDPMRVVNVQLREQAEAAIKDVVATMGIDAVLADKQPIIKELTSRLRHVAEGDGQDKGLGLRIVTVQIKEAVVASPRVWEMLQRPFRAERAKEARLAELTHQALVLSREAEAEKAAAAQKIWAESEAARLQAQAEAERFDREQSERVRRAAAEAASLSQTVAHEQEKIEKEALLGRLRVEQEIIELGLRREAENRQTRQEIEFEAARRKIDNDLSSSALQVKIIEALPGIAEKMPQPKELTTFALGGTDTLGSFLAALLKAIESFRNRTPAA